MDPKPHLLKYSWLTLGIAFAVVVLLVLPARAGAATYTSGLQQTGLSTAQIWFGNSDTVSFNDIFAFTLASTGDFSFQDLGSNNIGSPGSYNISPLTASLLDDSSVPLVYTASGPALINTTPFSLAAGSYNIQVVGTPGLGGGGGYWGSATITNYPTAPVPEPETYAMMLAGLGLMGFVARRRKQKHAI